MPQSRNATQLPAAFGFSVYNDDESGAVLNCIRYVSVEYDRMKWTMQQGGDPLSFEDVHAYRAKTVRERLTPVLLARYAAANGMRVFEQEYYGPVHRLISSSSGRDAVEIGLEDARAEWGLSR
jgi:hypothetical protein